MAAREVGAESTSPWALVKPLAYLLRKRANSQWYSTIHEDWRSKIIEDIEKSDSETIKPGVEKRQELDPNRGHPNNQDTETISLYYSTEHERWD